MKDKGFSLLELIIVLVLLSLSISLVVPSLSRLSKATELKIAAQKVSAILRFCRSEAVMKGKILKVIINPQLGEIRVQSMESNETKEKDEKIYLIPAGIQMKEVNTASAQYTSEYPTIEFYPNGGSNGGSLILKSDERKALKVDVHFLTGMVKVEKIESS